MARDVVYNKSAIIERCIARVHEEYQGDSANLENFSKQDAIVLNILRACEACIDLAMHVVSVRKLGIPQSSRDAFELLYSARLIDGNLSNRLKAMIGFRNIAVHDYQVLNLEIVKKIIEIHLGDFREFAEVILQLV
jgi:uncharacterized protein YutE (UPF0331/DUF86 family)